MANNEASKSNKIATEVKKQLTESNIDKGFVSLVETNLNDSEAFVRYSEIHDLLAYKKKDGVQSLLKDDKNGFIEGKDKDYYIEKMDSTGGRPLNEIYMTPDTVKMLCMAAQTEKGNQFRKYYIELEKCYKKIIADNIKLQVDNKLDNPIHILNKYDFDPNMYKNKEVLYLISIKDDIYKFGITADIVKRLRAHKENFNYQYVIKCWDCINRSISKNIEDAFKLYAKHGKIDHKLNNEKEIIKTNNIDLIIQVINKYVEKYVKEHKDKFKSSRLEQKNELIKNKIELLNKLSTYKGNNDAIFDGTTH